MGYPTVPRLACLVSVLPDCTDELATRLAAARDAATEARPGAKAWAGVAFKVDLEDAPSGDMHVGRPLGAPIDGVVEVSLPADDDPAGLMDAVTAIARSLEGAAQPDLCEVVLGTAYMAKVAPVDLAPYAMLLTFNRDRRTDSASFLYWWQAHHSRFNLGSPAGRPVGEKMVSYEMVGGDESLTSTAATAAGFGKIAEYYESVLIEDPSDFVATAIATGIGEAALYDEEGFISAEWRIGTPEDAAAALESGRDVLRTCVVRLLPEAVGATGQAYQAAKA
jgi:hypothetical protein